MSTLISSQLFRNETIIAEKQQNKDYGVAVSPEFEVDGETFRVILDGHHSYEAAIRDGVEPEFHEASENEDDRLCVLNRGEIEDFLSLTWIDTNYYNVST